MRYIASILIALMVTACGPVHKNLALDAVQVKGIQTLAVQVKSKENFEVFMDRGTATAGPAMMFGLIGAMAAAAHNSSKDKDREDQLSSYIDGYDHTKEVSDALLKGLNRQSDVTVVEVHDKASMQQSSADGVLTIQIKEWGLKVTDRRHESQVKAFVDVKRTFQLAGSHKKLMDVETTYFGGQSRSFSEYINDGELLKLELRQVLQKAGKQMAAKMVYVMGNKQ